jgi:RNA polymerase sigma-70 factor (ECF subfamily)
LERVMEQRSIDLAAVEASPRSFEEFFEQERHRLFRSLVLATNDRSEAEELTQDAFLRVWERWDQVAFMEEPAAYLHRTAFNSFLSRRRRAAVALRRRVFRISDDHDEIAQVDARHAVIAALQLLTPRQRSAVVLTHVLGYGSDEAGRLLGIKPSTVRELASRGRARLRKGMGERDD